MVWAIAKFGKGNFEVVFCDTNWEDKENYDYIKYIQEQTGITFIDLVSKKYPGGMLELAAKKKRFPSPKARFCTVELKVIPMIDYVLSLSGEVNVYQGFRREESEVRRKLNGVDDYFLHYFTPTGYDKKGKPIFHTYRRKEVLKWLKSNTAIVWRPLLDWPVSEVFKTTLAAGLKINPLYLQGFGRVGCMPCIMCTLKEMKIIAEKKPEVLEKIRAAETEIGSTFFPPDYIPERFASVTVTDKKGVPKNVPGIADVAKYTTRKTNKNQTNLFPQPENGCQSIYNLCE